MTTIADLVNRAMAQLRADPAYQRLDGDGRRQREAEVLGALLQLPYASARLVIDELRGITGTYNRPSTDAEIEAAVRRYAPAGWSPPGTTPGPGAAPAPTPTPAPAPGPGPGGGGGGGAPIPGTPGEPPAGGGAPAPPASGALPGTIYGIPTPWLIGGAAVAAVLLVRRR
jgi:hypothetical protein